MPHSDNALKLPKIWPRENAENNFHLSKSTPRGRFDTTMKLMKIVFIVNSACSCNTVKATDTVVNISHVTFKMWLKIKKFGKLNLDYFRQL